MLPCNKSRFRKRSRAGHDSLPSTSGKRTSSTLLKHEQEPRRPLSTIGAKKDAVVVRREHSLTTDELIAFCRERLAGYKTPKYVVIVDTLPKNASGKLLKRELRSTYSSLAETSTGAREHGL